MGNAEDARWLEAIHTKEWLDLQIELIKKLKESSRLNDYVKTCFSYDYIHLWNGIEYITNLLGLEMKESHRDCNNFPFEYSFEYGGARFSQISAERIPCSVYRKREENEDAGAN